MQLKADTKYQAWVRTQTMMSVLDGVLREIHIKNLSGIKQDQDPRPSKTIEECFFFLLKQYKFWLTHSPKKIQPEITAFCSYGEKHVNCNLWWTSIEAFQNLELIKNHTIRNRVATLCSKKLIFKLVLTA